MSRVGQAIINIPNGVEVKKEEITNNGREVQCGLCKFVWFFNHLKFNTSKQEKENIFNKYPGEIPRDVEMLISDAEKAKQ